MPFLNILSICRVCIRLEYCHFFCIKKCFVSNERIRFMVSFLSMTMRATSPKSTPERDLCHQALILPYSRVNRISLYFLSCTWNISNMIASRVYIIWAPIFHQQSQIEPNIHYEMWKLKMFHLLGCLYREFRLEIVIPIELYTQAQ